MGKKREKHVHKINMIITEYRGKHQYKIIVVHGHCVFRKGGFPLKKTTLKFLLLLPPQSQSPPRPSPPYLNIIPVDIVATTITNHHQHCTQHHPTAIIGVRTTTLYHSHHLITTTTAIFNHYGTMPTSVKMSPALACTSAITAKMWPKPGFLTSTWNNNVSVNRLHKKRNESGKVFYEVLSQLWIYWDWVCSV